MRLLGFIVAGSMAMVLLQAAAKVAVLLVFLAGVITFAARPTETIGCALAFILLGLFEHHPRLGFILLVALLVAGRIAKACSKPQDIRQSPRP